MDGIAVHRQNRHFLQLCKVGNPVGDEGKFFLRLINARERCKGERIPANVVVIAISTGSQGKHGQALVENENR